MYISYWLILIALSPIDSVDTGEIWSRLTLEERKRFKNALDNPTSNLARQLLATSIEVESAPETPWWEDTTTNEKRPTVIWELSGGGTKLQEIGSTHSLTVTSKANGSFKYNIVAI